MGLSHTGKGELPGEDSDSTEAAYMGPNSVAGHAGHGPWRMRAELASGLLNGEVLT